MNLLLKPTSTSHRIPLSLSRNSPLISKDRRSISNLPTNKKQLRKSIVMIHSLPSSNSLSEVLGPLVKEKKVGGVFVTDLNLDEEDVYSKFGGNWKEFVKGVEELNG